jgi:hypothetical protein
MMVPMLHDGEVAVRTLRLCRYSGSLRVGMRESTAIARKANAMRASTSAAVIQMLPRNTKAKISRSISATAGRITGPHDVCLPRAILTIYRGTVRRIVKAAWPGQRTLPEHYRPVDERQFRLCRQTCDGN